MTEQITIEILDSFEQATGFDVKRFLARYIRFTELYYSNIVNFYGGVISIMPTIALHELETLIEEQKQVIDVTILNASSISDYEYWALLEYVEDIGHTLETINNISKWLRSAITKDGYKQQVLATYMLSQNETLDRMERVKLKSNDPNNTWVDTALENELREEDYTSDGGALLKVVYKNNAALFLNSVVDNIDTAEKTYGLDLDKKIQFVPGGDLAVLSYQDTIKQAAWILSTLKKEDDPAYPDRGINSKTVIGSNVASIAYPILFRELASTFATDDTFRSFSITDVRRESDAIFIDFEAETKAGNSFNETIALS